MLRITAHFLLFFTMCGSFLGARAADAPPASAREAFKARHIILVSVDGLAAFYLEEPQADMPTLRRLAREGARARVRTVFPSMTWPAHTTIVTGVAPARHGVLANDYLERASGDKVTLLCDPVFAKDELVKAPTVYDAAHAAGLTTAGILWPASRSARSLDWTVPDMPGEGWERYGTRGWLEELRSAGLPIDRHGAWCKDESGGVLRDWLYVRMARQVLRAHAPNLLLIHLVEHDHAQHRFGPRSPESWWSASHSDDRLADLLAEASRPPLAGNTWLVVVSDHGFLPVRRTIQPNVVLVRLGLVEVTAGKVTRRDAWCVPQGGAAAVYILDRERREEIASRLVGELGGVKDATTGLEGVEDVIEPSRFASLGQPAPAQDARAPDLWLSAKPGYAFGDAFEGKQVVDKDPPGGTHGYLPDSPDMNSLLVAWGPGIAPGTDLGTIDLRDIAPTVARILGVELPSAEGRAIEAIARP